MNKFNIEFTVIEEIFGEATFEGEDMTEDEALDLLEEYVETRYPRMTEYTVTEVKAETV